MDNHLSAVLIHERPEPFEALKGALGDLSVESYCVKGSNGAEALIAQFQPLLVFVDLPIWSQSHADIVNMANAADQTFNIIVVGLLPDIEEYVSAVELGAFNFMAPPFSHDSLTMAVHSAAKDAMDRRALAKAILAHATT